MSPRSTGLRIAPSLIAVLLSIALLPESLAARSAAGPEAATDPVVDESTGSARYSIPIFVPPGPGGLVPNVTFSYSSRGGDGPFGVGWGLGLSAISCSDRLGAADYANCETYELDGQVLVEEGDSNVFHPVVETFERIEYVPDANEWKVTSTNGTIRRYGVNYGGSVTDTRIADTAGHVATWLLSEVQDPFGNTIYYQYDDTTDVGTRYLTKISGASGFRVG